MSTDFFEEFFDGTDTAKDHVTYQKHVHNTKRRLAMRRSKDKLNEVGVAPDPSPEILRQRDVYKNDFVLMHREVYPESTGLKPFGAEQEESIYRGQDVFHGAASRLLKLEPRGFAKTTRITNESLFAALSGLQKYIVILCSNLEKAQDILDSMKTELFDNDKLFELFPGPIACFRHLGDVPQKAHYQTYGGNKTYIQYGATTLQFPWVPGEPCSGCIIEVRPLTNVKGLKKKIKAGPDAGKEYRPSLYLLDDPQTHAEALSETSVRKIVAMIKRDALHGGSHSRRASAIMAITPVAPGDVAWYFEKEEHSWEIIKYKMITKFPDNHAWWMSEYAKVYLNYDRTIRGDRTRAGLEAKQLVEDNYDFAHEGAEWTWDHAYGWDEEPQIEISPLQHAYNIILDDGMESFEFECQSNTEYGSYEQGETIHAPVKQILTKTLPYKRNSIPQETQKVVAHIDVNKDILTYVIMSSPSPLRPHIIDYGTWPKQPGIFSKRNMVRPLPTLYPHLTDYREMLYKGVQDLTTNLMERTYIREDGIEVQIDRLGVDIKYEEVYITRAIRESRWRHVLQACSGTYVDADDPLLHEKERANALAIYENCYIEPNKMRTLDILYFDSDYFKTELHKGFNLEVGARGSATLYGLNDNGEELHAETHLQFADHLNIERPVRKEGKRKKKTKVHWEEKVHQADNEFFDNSVNCLALFVSEGIAIEITPSLSQKREERKLDMQEFINQQKKRVF
jgi:hypothetical protein